LNSVRSYGQLNAHVIGIVMKETVRRAIVAIRARRFVFEATAKPGRSGSLDDVVTSADREAQAIYLKTLRECFPDFGVIAEEDGLRVDSAAPGARIFFTVDPLDGTKAFVRKQSHGIGTMISLAADGEVIAAYIGDVMTREIYGFRPDSLNVHRISEFDHAQPLHIGAGPPLARQNVLLRTAPHRYSPAMRRIVGCTDEGGLFKGIDVATGSIGIGMARLWKGEVGAAALLPGLDPPWDMCPIVGISKKLGFVFLRETDAGKLTPFDPPVTTETVERPYSVLIVHESRLPELAPHQ
jgi:fructose-1,6-bisphosphatase/inositol monophosphatase family enzyme